MNSAAKDFVTLLANASSLGLVFKTNLFVGKEPTTPNDTVTLFDGVSSAPQLTLTKGEDYFYDAVQIRIRNMDYNTGYALAKGIMGVLHGLGQQTVNNTLYSVIYCSNGPAPLGWDDNGRIIFVLNFEVQRR